MWEVGRTSSITGKSLSLKIANEGLVFCPPGFESFEEEFRIEKAQKPNWRLTERQNCGGDHASQAQRRNAPGCQTAAKLKVECRGFGLAFFRERDIHESEPCLQNLCLLPVDGCFPSRVIVLFEIDSLGVCCGGYDQGWVGPVDGEFSDRKALGNQG